MGLSEYHRDLDWQWILRRYVECVADFSQLLNINNFSDVVERAREIFLASVDNLTREKFLNTEELFDFLDLFVLNIIETFAKDSGLEPEFFLSLALTMLQASSAHQETIIYFETHLETDNNAGLVSIKSAHPTIRLLDN